MRIAVRRYDPPPAERRYVAFYDVELGDRATILDALLRIVEHQDPTLAFRRMCRSGICGACAGMVNGTPRLFCQTLIRDAMVTPVPDRVAADILLGPLAPFRVLKDLVVDMDPFVEELVHCETWLEPRADYDGRMLPRAVEPLWSVSCCVLCGICVEDEREQPHPAAIARILRLAADPRDARGPTRLEGLETITGDRRARTVQRLRALCPAGVEIEPLLIPGSRARP